MEFKFKTSAEWRRRDRLSQVSCTSVTVFLIIFTIHHITLGNLRLVLILLCFIAFNLSALMLYRHFQKLNAFGYYLLCSYTGICLYLMSSGGTNDSGLLWLPCYPIIIYSFLVTRVAAIANITMALMAIFILFFASAPLYTATFDTFIKFIALSSFTLSSTFAFFQAHARTTSIEENDRLNQELQYIASTDELTELANRRDMSARLEFEQKRSNRSGAAFSVIIADIDYFKRVNDNFGHDTGDTVLKAFADVFSARFRDTDKVGRWGGEEFLVILPNTTLAEAGNIADAVRKSVSQTGLLPNMPHRLITMSAGVASSSEAEDVAELLKLADDRLYEAKDSGRNRIKPDPSPVVV